MAKPFSMEIRKRVVKAYNSGLGTINQVAKMFGITGRTVANYLQLDREIGDLTPKPLPGRPPILTETNLNIIKSIILTNRDGTLQNYRDAFKDKTGIEVTIVTMHNACKILNMNRKKKASLRKNKTGQTFKKNAKTL